MAIETHILFISAPFEFIRLFNSRIEFNDGDHETRHENYTKSSLVLIPFSLSRIICKFPVFVFCCRDLERDLSLSEDSEDEASKVKKKKKKRSYYTLV